MKYGELTLADVFWGCHVLKQVDQYWLLKIPMSGLTLW